MNVLSNFPVVLDSGFNLNCLISLLGGVRRKKNVRNDILISKRYRGRIYGNTFLWNKKVFASDLSYETFSLCKSAVLFAWGWVLRP